jgi:hypothetical protein
MSSELTFFDFKRKHSLGHSDIQKITGCDLAESRDWAAGKTAVPENIAQMLHGIDVVIDRIKTEQGIFTNSDAQHAAHIIEGLNKEISALKLAAKRDGEPQPVEELNKAWDDTAQQRESLTDCNQWFLKAPAVNTH